MISATQFSGGFQWRANTRVWCTVALVRTVRTWESDSNVFVEAVCSNSLSAKKAHVRLH